ncbi:MAG: hypothetical protein DMD96_30920 [Candidatus Rokuibacteriota bacterium]|nr:MAG: hypothetical protein DMD96_30920 [Candidatus Rokubacteria bacterium]
MCPLCSRTIWPADTVVSGYGHLSHLDCQRPRALSPEARALFSCCRDHAVGCVLCAGSFRVVELAPDVLGPRTLLCPQCRTDLTDSVRTHLYACAMLPEEVRRRAQGAREAAQALAKRSHQLRDSADVLIREAEAALDALREAMLEWQQTAGPLRRPPPASP